MFYILAGSVTPTNAALVAACTELGVLAALLAPEEAVRRARPGDTALARIDVLPTLDGVEPGLWELRRLAGRGVRILNELGALLATHDKLVTAIRLASCGVPSPKSAHIGDAEPVPPLKPPLVVKPRFGSWGRDVTLCESRDEFARCVHGLRRRRWFRKHGALVQELVPPQGFDLRVLVARGKIVGAIERRARRGEWRTNVALGGIRRSVMPSRRACATALAAAAAVGADFVGVDLLPSATERYVVVELNGAVDFNDTYGLGGRDPFKETVRALTVGDSGSQLS